MAVPPADSPLWTEVKRALAANPGLLLLPVPTPPVDRLLSEAVRRPNPPNKLVPW
jgi:hypothetical protein